MNLKEDIFSDEKLPKSHHITNLTQEIREEKNQKGGCLCLRRNSRDLNRSQGLYAFPWRVEWDRAFQGDALWVRIGRISSTELGIFTL